MNRNGRGAFEDFESECRDGRVLEIELCGELVVFE